MNLELPSIGLKKLFAFNIGEEINLVYARNKFSLRESEVFKITKFNRELVLNSAPLVLNLPPIKIVILGEQIHLDVFVKIWSFGVISVSFNALLKNKSLVEISKFTEEFENSEEIMTLAKIRVQELAISLGDSIVSYSIWDDFEDYLILTINDKDIDLSKVKDQLYFLMERNIEGNLSRHMRESHLLATCQYTEKDLIIVDWNQAMIVGDQIELDELSMILDFALCQLVILRFYDDLLDKKLSNLYKSLRRAKSNFLNNQYAKYTKESALLYIELSDVIDLVSNSVKFIGDTYYAQIYRLAIQRFRVPDFSLTVKTKLKSLSEVSNLFSSEINERRNQIMELIIIVLIFIEVVPFLYDLVIKWIPAS